ncbi:WecB/TagA/CpsF family glycosyltransferase [Methylobacterium fujisawaense]|uniref:WecB/TagA/CpsF family glycosyltransferase n=1 Tax=Methylobacterium fujisawaense TaxID=107400 RepID=UPI003CEECDB3
MSHFGRLSTYFEWSGAVKWRHRVARVVRPEGKVSGPRDDNTPQPRPVYGALFDESSGQTSLIRVGGIPTAVLSRKQLARRMDEDCRLASLGHLVEPRIIVASNGSVIARFHVNNNFRKLISKASIVDADGASLVFASRLFCRIPLPERVATTDLIHDCADLASQKGIRFYFLGGKPEVALRASQKLKLIFPDLQVVGCRDGYFNRADADEICSEILSTGAQVLWLGLGSPMQEEIACSWQKKLGGLAWIRTCGGLFDHIAEDVPRAPRWMQGIGLEWLYRIYQEPRRLLFRYIWSNPVAIFYLLTKTSDEPIYRGSVTLK